MACSHFKRMYIIFANFVFVSLHSRSFSHESVRTKVLTRFKRHSPLKVQIIASHIMRPIGNYTTLDHQEKYNKYGIQNVTHAIVQFVQFIYDV
jgi:hypothetical protein